MWQQLESTGIKKEQDCPDGRNEGKPGSARVLNVSNTEKAPAVTFFTILQPLRKGVAPRPVTLEGNRLTVGTDTFHLGNGIMECNGQKVPYLH